MRAIRGRAATAMVAITASGRVAGDEKRSDQQLIARFWRRPRRSKADLPLGMVENGEDLAHEDFAQDPHVVIVHLTPERFDRECTIPHNRESAALLDVIWTAQDKRAALKQRRNGET